jgi:hypothetical protein
MASPAEMVAGITGCNNELAQAVLDNMANDVSGTLFPLSPCPPLIFQMEADYCAPAMLFLLLISSFIIRFAGAKSHKLHNSS